MRKIVTIILKSIRYSGDSIGNDFAIEVEALGKTVKIEKKIKRGETLAMDTEISKTTSDKSSLTFPIIVRMTERDFLFNDTVESKIRATIKLSEEKQEPITARVPIRESRGILPGKRKAVFDIAFRAHVISEDTDYRNKSITWWKTWEQIKNYTYRGVNGKEDCNRYDSVIANVVAKWNKAFCDDDFPPQEPLDPNLVKAIIYQESRMGYDRTAGIDVMQVGNVGDPALKTLRGELKESWIHRGRLQQLKYDARVTTVEESITWGTRWLYHKAQKPAGDGTRVWLSWHEAVGRYGPPRKIYTEGIWSIYTKGIKHERKRSIQLWLLLFLACAGSSFIFFKTYVDISLQRMIMETIAKEDRIRIERITSGSFGGSQLFFWAVIAHQEDWWEKLKIGRRVNGSIQWLTIDHPPTEQSILKVRFLTLNGFRNPVLEVYGKTHMGNGAFYLYEVGDSTANLLLEAPRAVDSHNENAVRLEHEERYGYFSCSEVIEGGAFTSEYYDLNNDGTDDLALHGMTNTFCETYIGTDEMGYAQTKNIVVERKDTKTYFIWDAVQQRYTLHS